MASGIDASTKRILRKVLYAAIEDDEAVFKTQLASFATPAALMVACGHATDLAALVFVDKFEGRPTAEAAQQLADGAAAFAEEWSGIGTAHFAAFINAMFEGTPIEEVLPASIAVRVPFVFAGHLLVKFHQPDEQWFDYLDRLWNTLEDPA